MRSIFFERNQKKLRQSSKSNLLSIDYSIQSLKFSLLTTPLWNVSIEDKLKLSSTRLLNLCERVITIIPSTHPYRFPPSSLHAISQFNFGHVNWWNITTTDPENDEVKTKIKIYFHISIFSFLEIPMTQLARILDENDDEPVI